MRATSLAATKTGAFLMTRVGPSGQNVCGISSFKWLIKTWDKLGGWDGTAVICVGKSRIYCHGFSSSVSSCLVCFPAFVACDICYFLFYFACRHTSCLRSSSFSDDPHLFHLCASFPFIFKPLHSVCCLSPVSLHSYGLRVFCWICLLLFSKRNLETCPACPFYAVPLNICFLLRNWYWQLYAPSPRTVPEGASTLLKKSLYWTNTDP